MLNIFRRVASIEPNLRVCSQLNRIRKCSTQKVPLAIKKKKGKSTQRSVCNVDCRDKNVFHLHLF